MQSKEEMYKNALNGIYISVHNMKTEALTEYINMKPESGLKAPYSAKVFALVEVENIIKTYAEQLQKLIEGE